MSLKSALPICSLFSLALWLLACQPANAPNSGVAPTPANISSASPAPTPSESPAPRKPYSAMTAAEQREFIEQQTRRIATMMGARDAGSITPGFLERIQTDADSYASRTGLPMPEPGRCGFGQNLVTTLERGRIFAPQIIRAFNEREMPPVMGLYLAMIESEFCPCLQSPTGPLGMFQLTQAEGRSYGLSIIAGATPSNPDERCEPERAAAAASASLRYSQTAFADDALAPALAILSRNSGVEATKAALQQVLTEQNRACSICALTENAARLNDQFQSEGIRYLPKFFAAAIVGENPQVFGAQGEPLSSGR